MNKHGQDMVKILLFLTGISMLISTTIMGILFFFIKFNAWHLIYLIPVGAFLICFIILIEEIRNGFPN